ncbi:uncharacterized protein DEA37_0003121 [Paragonimus westermani]|uniref:Uncharacterized protein n=1 Tax=Paragonimus westermani TaxID=34504 RepID=A0A5J4NHS4_9TREM|nr:uncharacterized protein DEA37_0003121 [Paragonimus westermani]
MRGQTRRRLRFAPFPLIHLESAQNESKVSCSTEPQDQPVSVPNTQQALADRETNENNIQDATKNWLWIVFLPLSLIAHLVTATVWLARMMPQVTISARNKMRRRIARDWRSMKQGAYVLYNNIETFVRKRIAVPCFSFIIDRLIRRYQKKRSRDDTHHNRFIKHKRYKRIIGRFMIFYLKIIYHVADTLNSKMDVRQWNEYIQHLHHYCLLYITNTWSVFINLGEIVNNMVDIVKVCSCILMNISSMLYFLAQLIITCGKMLSIVSTIMYVIHQLLGYETCRDRVILLPKRSEVLA